MAYIRTAADAPLPTQKHAAAWKGEVSVLQLSEGEEGAALPSDLAAVAGEAEKEFLLAGNLEMG